MSVPELKNLLKLEGLAVSGKKAELIARLREYSGKPKPEVASARKKSASGKKLPRPKLPTVYAWACRNPVWIRN
jgi:hypothetical protein